MFDKAVVCYSGGHDSALVAIEAVRKYGKENVILLNHDISAEVEHADIKRFKNEVAQYLDVEITYANHKQWEEMTPLKLSVKLSAFSSGTGNAFCTRELKSKPFMKWLKDNYPVMPDMQHNTLKEVASPNDMMNDNIVILYGFDKNEPARIQRRSQSLGIHGYKTDFPLAYWERTIYDTKEIGIMPPSTYRIYKHANCVGCLKAGKQHWYCVFCLRPDLWEEAKDAERQIGHSIIKGVFLEELEPKFIEMRYSKGICPSEKGKPNTFWAMVESVLPEQMSLFPCECAI